MKLIFLQFVFVATFAAFFENAVGSPLSNPQDLQALLATAEISDLPYIDPELFEGDANLTVVG
jgi:hypothetical protein